MASMTIGHRGWSDHVLWAHVAGSSCTALRKQIGMTLLLFLKHLCLQLHIPLDWHRLVEPVWSLDRLHVSLVQRGSILSIMVFMWY